mgnify:CR=1 FL=1
MWTEKKIQEILAWHCINKGHHGICPNSGVFGWEADLVSFTNSFFGNEYEIKITKSNFRQDKKKQRKHWELQKSKQTGPSYKNTPGPVYFWYCCPAELAAEIKLEIPEYAGLLAVRVNFVEVIKRAPRLHKEPISQQQYDFILRGLMFRYWKQRNKNRIKGGSDGQD